MFTAITRLFSFNRANQAMMPGMIKFECNICGTENVIPASISGREIPSCHSCGSTLRMREIIHSLSIALFHKSLSLDEFPINRDITGIGLSDWDGYAIPLSQKMNYQNTYYHKAPQLDITAKPTKKNIYDFIISSDVFEHVTPPVYAAFKNTFDLLKDDGVFVFSVPYTYEGHTIEHFFDLYQYEIITKNGKKQLLNTTKDNKKEVFEDLIFHGGEGTTLEMRVFAKDDLIKTLNQAGFKSVQIVEKPCYKHGIYTDLFWSRTIIARKEKPLSHILSMTPSALVVNRLTGNKNDNEMIIQLSNSVSASSVEIKFGDVKSPSAEAKKNIIYIKIPKAISSTVGVYPVTVCFDRNTCFYVGDFTVYHTATTGKFRYWTKVFFQNVVKGNQSQKLEFVDKVLNKLKLK